MKNSRFVSVAGRLRPWLASSLSVGFLGLLLCGMAASPAHAVFGDKKVQDDLLLGEIILEGNTRTDDILILRELGMQVGDPFDHDKMDTAWDTLEDIGYFAFVDMEYEEGDDGRVVWRIMVEEDMTTAYGPLVRYDRRHKYHLGAWLEDTNLRGKGEVLKISAAALYLQRVEASWRRPWLFHVKGLESILKVSGQHADFVFRPTRYRQYQGDLALRWRFRGPFYVQAGLNYGQDDYRDRYRWALPDRGEGAGPVATFEPVKQTRTALSAALGVDTRSNPWYPRRGVFVEAGVRSWQSGDFENYTETSLDARFFVPVPVGQHILAVRGFGRRVDGPAHLDNVLFYGGPETIRGYRFGGLEGDEGYLLSVEYRIPLFIMPISPRGEMVGLGLHAFGDAGDAWYEGAEAGRALQSFGVGAHLNLDTLQLRFEAAKPREGDWRFEFMDTFNF